LAEDRFKELKEIYAKIPKDPENTAKYYDEASTYLEGAIAGSKDGYEQDMLSIVIEVNQLRKKNFLLKKKVKESNESLNIRMDNIMTEVNKLSAQFKDMIAGK